MNGKKAKAIRRAFKQQKDRKYQGVGIPVRKNGITVYHFTYVLHEDDPRALYKLGKRIYRELGVLPREVLDGLTATESGKVVQG